jgi:hypothetical protein
MAHTVEEVATMLPTLVPQAGWSATWAGTRPTQEKAQPVLDSAGSNAPHQNVAATGSRTNVRTPAIAE